MLKRHAKLVTFTLFALDQLTTIGAFLAAFWILRVNPLALPTGRLMELGQYLWLLLLIVPLWTICLQVSGLYSSYRTVPVWREFGDIARALALCSLSLFSVLALTKASHISRPFMALFLGLDALSLILLRVAVRRTAHWLRAWGYNYRTAIIVGTGRSAQNQALRLLRNPHWGFRLLGFVDDGSPAPGSETWEVPVLGTIGDIRRLLCEHVVDEVFIAVGSERLSALDGLFVECEQVGAKTRLAPDLFPHRIARMEIDEFDGTPLLTFTTTPAEDWPLFSKRAMDVLGSALFLISFSWLYAIIALLIKWTSQGPVFYKQERAGINGRRFMFYKFRSMVMNADKKVADLAHLNEMDGPVFKIKNDPRVTPVGRFLRKYSLDELPQMWNVLKGDMSLVGPRPPLPSEVKKYDSWHRRRLSIRPGLTCLWQVQGRNAIDFRRWMELDLAYIDNWSLALDLKILLKTIPAVLGGRGAS
jgi:exopolysaccharide biosynthesis polyprenyl glycosylphosphotransferase